MLWLEHHLVVCLCGFIIVNGPVSGLGDGLVNKLLSAQARGPAFSWRNPCKSWVL